MPLRQDARYADTGTVDMVLPMEAKPYQPGLEKNLIQGDHVKISVLACSSVRETFWAKFVMLEGDMLTARIDNELRYTNHHGLRDEELIVVPLGKIQAVLEAH